ncbi:MAG: DUF3429 domain-containing protein [Thalassotalea sp.]|nr:DUF3429 domain-containing protein [Thalassotalea sp.]
MKTWQSLGYLGLFPFFISLVLGLFIEDWQYNAQQAFIFYSAIILSFISGTLWQAPEGLNRQKQQIVSNVFCLLAFSSLMLAHSIALVILTFGYLFIFFYEKSVRIYIPKTKEYIKMRFRLTLIVVLLHCCALMMYF